MHISDWSSDVCSSDLQLDIATLDLPFPQGIEDIEASISAVARALGREGQGRRLIARIDHLQRSRPKRQHDTVWLGGGGRSVASKGLAAQWMALAGFRQRPLKGDRISLEQLLIRERKSVVEGKRVAVR